MGFLSRLKDAGLALVVALMSVFVFWVVVSLVRTNVPMSYSMGIGLPAVWRGLDLFIAPIWVLASSTYYDVVQRFVDDAKARNFWVEGYIWITLVSGVVALVWGLLPGVVILLGVGLGLTLVHVVWFLLMSGFARLMEKGIRGIS